jgi:hypothetical protein
MWYIYPTEYYLAIKKSEILSFAGEWMELENSMLSEVNQVQKGKGHMFSPYLDDRPKYKYKHYHIYKYIQNMFPIVGLLEKTRVGGKEENDRE